MPTDSQNEFTLKVLQAWSAMKFKMANIALIGNGTGLAGTATFLKDKGVDHAPLVAALLWAFGAGTILAAGAMIIAYVASDRVFSRLRKGTPDAEMILGDWRVDLLYNLFLAGAIFCFLFCVGFLSGGTTAMVVCPPGKC